MPNTLLGVVVPEKQYSEGSVICHPQPYLFTVRNGEGGVANTTKLHLRKPIMALDRPNTMLRQMTRGVDWNQPSSNDHTICVCG